MTRITGQRRRPATRAAIGAALVAALFVAGCSGNRSSGLIPLRSTTPGPDEFAILPPKPLSMPENLAALPEPTPGGSNRTDPTPIADATLALGGSAAALTRPAPTSDSAILAHATRFGVAPGIRADLAAADRDYRRRNRGRLLERVFNITVYYRVYEPLSLDQTAELERWRARGVRTVGAPPEPQ